MRLFFLVFTLLPLIGQGYVMWRTWKMLPKKNLLRWGAILAELAAFCLFFVHMAGNRDTWPLWLSSFMYEVGTGYLVVLLYLLLIFVVLDILRLIRVLPKHIFYNNAKTSLIIALALLVVLVYGNVHYHNKQRVELSYTSEKVTKPLKLVMVSDLHLGYHNVRKDLKKWIKLINDENPDLVLIAGDLIDGSIRPVNEEQMYEEFKALKAPVYACLGNHDYMTGTSQDMEFCQKAGIHVLVDSVAYVGGLALISRDDRTNRERKSLKDIMQGIDRSKYIIELDHQPYNLEEAEQNGVDLELAGHTHDGQIWPIKWITRSMYECSYGSWKRGDTQYYISSGLGIWGPEFRIGTDSEYVVINLN